MAGRLPHPCCRSLFSEKSKKSRKVKTVEHGVSVPSCWRDAYPPPRRAVFPAEKQKKQKLRKSKTVEQGRIIVGGTPTLSCSFLLFSQFLLFLLFSKTVEHGETVEQRALQGPSLFCFFSVFCFSVFSPKLLSTGNC